MLLSTFIASGHGLSAGHLNGIFASSSRRPLSGTDVQRHGALIASFAGRDWRTFRAGLIADEQKQQLEQQDGLSGHVFSDEDTGDGAPQSPSSATAGDAPPPPPANAALSGAGRSRADWWVHELAMPESGCVLLAQPGAIFPEQPLLHRAAVLVLEYSEVTGTVGLLLGRSTNRTVAALLEKRKEPALYPFRNRPLWIGGNVLARGRGLRVLTRRCDVPGRWRLCRASTSVRRAPRHGW